MFNYVSEGDVIVLLTRLAKHDLSQVCTHDVIVQVCVYVCGAITGSCAKADVAQSRALWRREVQLKQYTMALQASIVKVKEFFRPSKGGRMRDGPSRVNARLQL